MPPAYCVQDISFAARRLKDSVVRLDVGSRKELLGNGRRCREEAWNLFSNKLPLCRCDRVITAGCSEVWKKFSKHGTKLVEGENSRCAAAFVVRNMTLHPVGPVSCIP